MIHQPSNVVGVVVYAVMSLIAVACAWVRLRSRSATTLQRKAGWCVLLIGPGLAGYAADDWYIATEWPPVSTIHYAAWHYAGPPVSPSVFCSRCGRHASRRTRRRRGPAHRAARYNTRCIRRHNALSLPVRVSGVALSLQTESYEQCLPKHQHRKASQDVSNPGCCVNEKAASTEYASHVTYAFPYDHPHIPPHPLLQHTRRAPARAAHSRWRHHHHHHIRRWRF